TCIVEVVAVDHVTETTIDRDRLEPAVQLMLAEIAPVCRVGNVVRVSHFGGRDDFMPQTKFADNVKSNGALMRGVTRALRSDRKRITSKGLTCHYCEVRTIDATAESNDA